MWWNGMATFQKGGKSKQLLLTIKKRLLNYFKVTDIQKKQ